MIITITLLGCARQPDKSKWSIKGSWYNAEINKGYSSTYPMYYELYFEDSTFRTQDQDAGQVYERKYKIVGDTLFLGGLTSDDRIAPFAKIDKLSNDTLYMTVNRKYYDTNDVVNKRWMRLPSNELGYYELGLGTHQDDSLAWKIVFDFERRKQLYDARMADRMDLYDSMLKAGEFDWNMKAPLVQDWIERRALRRRNDSIRKKS